MKCPNCGKEINCAAELGKRNKGITSEAKRRACRANLEKARQKLQEAQKETKCANL